MTKKLVSLLLILTMLLCAFPVSASAETTDSDIRNQIVRCYKRTLAANGVSDLDGYCGQLAGYMLYFLGVEKYPVTFNGKDMYDYYVNKDITTGGCRVRRYSAKQYSLESALNTMSHYGTHTVYNILVGFQRTNTSAGSRYGHAMVIHAIMDGNVYFTESFNGAHGLAGTPIRMSIAEFAQSYSQWAVFEGAVMFGKADYMEMCQLFGSSGYVMLTQDTSVLQKLCEDVQDAPVVRVARAGERMIVTGVMEDIDGRLYYRVRDDGACAYIDATAAEMICSHYDSAVADHLEIPQAVKAGGTVQIRGELPQSGTPFEAYEIRVYDAQGELVQTCVNTGKKEIKIKLSTQDLPDGCYRLDFVADALNYSVHEGELTVSFESAMLRSSYLTVGDAQMNPHTPATARTVVMPDGWVLEDGVWHCYNHGAPRTGWYCDNGIDYYLKADGSVTTGWQNIAGKRRFFGETGALRTGWMQLENGMFYMRKNGVAAEGWYNVGGINYYFGENGLVTQDGWLQTDKGFAYLQNGGQALTGWNTVDGNRYFFDASGMLFSQMQIVDGQSVLVRLEDDPSIAPVM